MDFVETAAGTRGEQTEVVAHLVNLQCKTFHGGAVLNHAAGSAGGFDKVVGKGNVPAGDFAEGFDASIAIAGFGADAGADGGGAHVDGEELVGSVAEVGHFTTQGSSESAEGLAEGHRNSVLKLGTTHLDDVCELFGLFVKGVDHHFQMGHEGQVFEAHGHMDSARVSVVGALRSVDNVVGGAELVFTTFVAHFFKGEVGDNLVGSHVGAGTGTTLDHVDGELLVETSGDKLVASPADSIALFGSNHADFDVGHRGSFLGDGHALDEVGVAGKQVAADMEVVHGTAGLHAVVNLFGNFLRAEEVTFCTIIFFVSHYCCLILFMSLDSLSYCIGGRNHRWFSLWLRCRIGQRRRRCAGSG